MHGSLETNTKDKTVLIASSSALRRYGLSQLLQSGDTKTRETDRLDGLHAELAQGDVDIIVLELGASAIADVDTLRRLRQAYPRVNLLAITQALDRKQFLDVLEAGAHGCVYEADTPRDLVNAVNCVRDGEIYTPLSLAADTSGDIANGLDTAPIKLSERQRELLPLIARGLSNKEIAQQLQISLSTAKFHVSTILRSLNSSNRAEAASKATLLIRRR